MNRTRQLVLTVSLVLLMAGCATLRSGSHQADLECPSDLASYCGGWTVYASAVDAAVNHVLLNDQMVIGKRNNGTDPLAIFPRDSLIGRWAGAKEVPLKEITSGNSHSCMVGRVRIPTGTGHESGSSSHEWHAITLRIELLNNGAAFGAEEELKICMNQQTGGGWPSSCAPVNCEYDTSTDPRNHGGRAHARD